MKTAVLNLAKESPQFKKQIRSIFTTDRIIFFEKEKYTNTELINRITNYRSERLIIYCDNFKKQAISVSKAKLATLKINPRERWLIDARGEERIFSRVDSWFQLIEFPALKLFSWLVRLAKIGVLLGSYIILVPWWFYYKVRAKVVR